MNSNFTDSNDTTVLLGRIHQGMTVFDNKDDEIGKVEFVYFGAQADTNENTHTTSATHVPNPAMTDATIPGMIADVFSPQDEVPEALADRLRMSGFIRVDSNRLLASDRYVMPDQIGRVHDEHVHLNVSYDELIKRV